MLEKPEQIFNRDFEWRHLSRFVGRIGTQPQLGIVSGRRRQGKTYLLEALAETCGGFYFEATQGVREENLRKFAAALARHLGHAAPPRLDDWDDAMSFLYRTNFSGPVVIDEFPYLSMADPEIPSILQRELDGAARSEVGPSLLLCGSAMSVMGKLLGGGAPLRGRANLELVLKPFSFRMAANYWGIEDATTAALMNAVVGGTPAYRRFIDGDCPTGAEDFDDWVCRTVLDPGTPLFREGRYLLDEDLDVRDTPLYHSALAAIASGNATRARIAAYLGRKSGDIGHHLAILEDCGLISRDEDVFQPKNVVYEINEPLLKFYQVVMRPAWALLETGRARAVWQDAKPRFTSGIMGRHFEYLCRDYALDSPHWDLVGRVGRGVVPDPANRTQIELDVVALAPTEPGSERKILSIGEAKWGKVLGGHALARLARARDLLSAKGYDTSDTVLTLYSAKGSVPDLVGDNIATIGLDDIYTARSRSL